MGGLSVADALSLCELLAKATRPASTAPRCAGCSGSSMSGCHHSARRRLLRQRWQSCGTEAQPRHGYLETLAPSRLADRTAKVTWGAYLTESILRYLCDGVALVPDGRHGTLWQRAPPSSRQRKSGGAEGGSGRRSLGAHIRAEAPTIRRSDCSAERIARQWVASPSELGRSAHCAEGLVTDRLRRNRRTIRRVAAHFPMIRRLRSRVDGYRLPCGPVRRGYAYRADAATPMRPVLSLDARTHSRRSRRAERGRTRCVRYQPSKSPPRLSHPDSDGCQVEPFQALW
jgi:hypothetical protein